MSTQSKTSMRERMKEMIEQGIAPKEIAKRLNVKPQTVYTFKHILKKQAEEAQSQATENKAAEKVSATKGEKAESTGINDAKYQKLQEEYDDLKHRFDNVIKNYDSLEMQIDKLTKEVNVLDKENISLINDKQELNKKLHELVAESTSTNNSEIQSLKKIIEELQEENRLLEESYLLQKSLHVKLLDYISVSYEWSKKHE